MIIPSIYVGDVAVIWTWSDMAEDCSKCGNDKYNGAGTKPICPNARNFLEDNAIEAIHGNLFCIPTSDSRPESTFITSRS